MTENGNTEAGVRKPITSFIKAWRVACTRAGCPGRIPTTCVDQRSVRSSVPASPKASP